MARTKRKTTALLSEAEPQQSKIYRAAGYVRLSVEDSGKPGADTIESQKVLLSEYIESKPDLSFCGLFCDNGRTGTDFERPQFEKLMDAVRSGEVNCIVVKDLSRFGRNYKETGNYLERIFPFLGVRFIAVTDNFDTLTAERTQDGYIVPLKNIINEVYSKDISHKVCSALETKQRQGDFIGAWAPYGYRKDPENKNHLLINEETAPVVRQIFAWRSEGVGVGQIARRLNDAGVVSPSAYLHATGEVKTEKYKGALWQQQNLKNILTHPVYVGHMVQGRKKQSFYSGKAQFFTQKEDWKIVENTHDPIIDTDTFETVQRIMKQKKESYFQNLGKYDRLATTPNILRQLVYCPCCNRPMVRYKNVCHEQKLIYSFICPGHANDPKRCPFVSISEDELIAVVLESTKAQIAIAAELGEVTKKLEAAPKVQERRNELERKTEAARRTLKRSQSLYDSLYQNYAEKLMTEQEYISLKAHYQAEAERAEQLLASLAQDRTTAVLQTPENPFLRAFQAFRDNDTLDSEMAHALIERIYIDADHRMDIRFRFRDEYRALLEYIEGVNAE